MNTRYKITVYERYSRGEIGESLAHVLLSEKLLDQMDEEKESFESAMERDTSGFLAGNDE